MSSGIPITIKKGELTLEQFKHSNILSLVSKYLLKQKKELNPKNIKDGLHFAFIECQKEFSKNHFVKNIIYYKMKEKTLEKPINRETCNVPSALDKILSGKSDEISDVLDSYCDSNSKISKLDEFIEHPGIYKFFNETYVPNKFPDRIEG